MKYFSEFQHFDTLPTPLFVVNEESQIMYANEAINQIIDIIPKKTARKKFKFHELFKMTPKYG